MFRWIALFSVISLGLASGAAAQSKKYDEGATDTEIKFGGTMIYSGNFSSYGVVGRTQTAYFKMINDEGGINGRMLNFISLDDGYSPPKTVELVRRLVEQDRVLFLFSIPGSASGAAVQKYLNQKKIPQLFNAASSSRFADPANSPWTIAWPVDGQTEASAFAQYILATRPDAKIGVLYQHDDYGSDYLTGLHKVLGDKTDKMIVKEVSYDSTDPTVDSQVISLMGAGVDTFVDISTPKFTSQAIRKVAEIGWKPAHFITNVSSSIATLNTAGAENAVGIISSFHAKDPADPRWADDSGYRHYMAFMKKYQPDADANDSLNVRGYNMAQTLEQVLRQCGDELTRENIMRQATHLENLQLPMMLPGIMIETSPTNYHPVSHVQLFRFDGKTWVPLSEVIKG